MKKNILAIIAVFVLWQVLDFLIHGVLLSADYEATASLWRPMEEMKMGLMYVVGAVYAVCFVLIYALLITEKRIGTAIKYGLLFGIAAGIGMGYGTYAVMPLTYKIALSGFWAPL